MSKSQKKSLLLIIITGILLVLSVLASSYTDSVTFKIIIFAFPYITIGAKVFYKSFARLRRKDFLDENFLMSIASIGAFILGEYIEAVAVLLFYAVGELFESIAVGKSRKSIGQLMDICPEYANIEQNGEIIKKDPAEVEVDDIIVAMPGEKIPLDGIVTDGFSTIDTSALTGESEPGEIACGDEIYSGCINLSSVLRIRVTKPYSESTVSKILELVENSAMSKSKSENFISKFAKYYTPIVVGLAVLVAFVPPLFSGTLSQWIAKALVFLVVSCPCALVISVPLSFFAGIGAASKAGILVKGSTYIERLANADTVVFDKTGTLTRGKFEVVAINSADNNPEQLLELAAKAEYFSSHPIAVSVKAAFEGKIDVQEIGDITEIPGCGICADISGQKVLAGNKKLMEKYSINYSEPDEGTAVHIAVDNCYKGSIVISDQIKPNAKTVIKAIKGQGVSKTVMLTGDKKAVAHTIANSCAIDEYKSDLFPQDKVLYTEEYINNSKKSVVYVGDGINDAPVLARADVGIAMGAIGTDSAIEAADIVLMDDRLEKIPLAISISKKTMGIVKQNIAFSIGIKVCVMLLSLIGYANMWMAVFADVGVSVIAILNAMRCFKYKSEFKSEK